MHRGQRSPPRLAPPSLASTRLPTAAPTRPLAPPAPLPCTRPPNAAAHTAAVAAAGPHATATTTIPDSPASPPPSAGNILLPLFIRAPAHADLRRFDPPPWRLAASPAPLSIARNDVRVRGESDLPRNHVPVPLPLREPADKRQQQPRPDPPTAAAAAAAAAAGAGKEEAEPRVARGGGLRGGFALPHGVLRDLRAAPPLLNAAPSHVLRQATPVRQRSSENGMVLTVKREEMAGGEGERVAALEAKLREQGDAMAAMQRDMGALKAELARMRVAAERRAAEVVNVNATAAHSEARINDVELALAAINLKDGRAGESRAEREAGSAGKRRKREELPGKEVEMVAKDGVQELREEGCQDVGGECLIGLNSLSF
ncbi:unnamed protein product [Closterium sp. Naga37s-1]|nr:unnamed protein product [Closterium sp. Naga37s-1]